MCGSAEITLHNKRDTDVPLRKDVKLEKKKKETNLVLFHLSGDFLCVGWRAYKTLKSARVSISTPKEEGGKNEKREEPKSNASSQEVLVIILTPCGRADKDIKTEQASRLLLLLYESSPALNLTGTRSHYTHALGQRSAVVSVCPAHSRVQEVWPWKRKHKVFQRGRPFLWENQLFRAAPAEINHQVVPLCTATQGLIKWVCPCVWLIVWNGNTQDFTAWSTHTRCRPLVCDYFHRLIEGCGCFASIYDWIEVFFFEHWSKALYC